LVISPRSTANTTDSFSSGLLIALRPTFHLLRAVSPRSVKKV
jgi:hypothetical protein